MSQKSSQNAASTEAARSDSKVPGLERARVRANPMELVLCILTLLIGVIALVHAMKLPSASTGPIGPAAFPVASSLLLIGFSAVLGSRSALALIREHEPVAFNTRTTKALAATFGLTVAYVLLIPPLGYRWATVLFLACLGLMLSDLSRRAIAINLLGAILLGFGLQFIFTQYLVLDLP